MIKCKFENGKEADIRHVTVGAIAVNDKNEILLIKRAPHLLRGDKYSIPGGFLDRDETTGQGALRELLEETGIKGKVEYLFKIEDRPERLNEEGPTGRQNVDFIYIIRTENGDFRDNDEVTDIKWFTRENIPSVEEFAFDHHEIIMKYYEYLNKSFPIPIVGGLL